MPATVGHVLTATTPDDTSYEIRPSHWNDTHAVTFNQNWQATGNTTQSTSGSGDGMVISGAGLASVGVSNNSIIISVPAGAPSPVNFSAGTTSNNLGSVVFSNSNGISFGLNGSTITAQHNALTSQSNQAASASNGSFTFQTLGFSNANNVTFGTSAGGIITASVNPGGGAAFSAGISGGNTSGNTGTVSNQIVLAGGNNITVSGSTNAGGMTVTISGAAAGGAQTAISGVGVSDTTYTSGTVIWSAQANVTLGSSVNGASQYVRVSVANQSVQPVAASGSNGSFAFSTLSMGSSNGMHFYTTNGSIVGSYTRNAASNAIQSVGSATGSGTNTSRFAADDHVHAGVFSMGVSTGGNTSGDTRVDVGRFVLQGGNNVTLSQITGAGALNTIVISGAAAGGVQTGISGIGVSDTTYTSGSVIFSAQANVTLGSSVNGASQYVRISVAAPGGGGGASLSLFDPSRYIAPTMRDIAANAATFTFGDFKIDAPVVIDRFGQRCFFSNASNSTGTYSISLWAGIYTKNVSTLSLWTWASSQFVFTGSGSVGNASLQFGVRIATLPLTTTLSVGDYWMGIAARLSTAGANASFSLLVNNDVMNSSLSGVFGVASATSQHWRLGVGRYTASSTAIPNSVAFSHISGHLASVQNQPQWLIMSGTV